MSEAKYLTGTVPEDAREVALTREQHRHRRKREVRPRTVQVSRLSKRDLAVGAAEFPERDYWRPTTRGDCAGIERPCPFVACRYNLFLDIDQLRGSIKLNYPDLEPDALNESCALDVADQGGETLEVVGELMNMTRERVRQVEEKALVKIGRRRHLLKEFAEQGLTPCRAHQEGK